MKKLLFAIGIIVVLCSATKWWTDLTVNGSIIKTDPTYSGTLTIAHSANNTYTFSGTGPGTFMIAGPGNATDFSSQRLTALVRGATFGSSTTGVDALDATYGIVHLNQNTGRTLIGSNITDDGSTQFQTYGIKGTSLNLGPTTAGYVLTADASGNYTPQAVPTHSGISSGTFTPTFTNNSGCTAFTLRSASYSKNGNIVSVHISVDVTQTANITGGSFKFTVPTGLPFSSTLTQYGSGTLNGITQYNLGQVTETPGSVNALFSFTLDSSVSFAHSCTIDIQYSL